MFADRLLKQQLAAQVSLPQQAVRILSTDWLLCSNNTACQYADDKYVFDKQPADPLSVARIYSPRMNRSINAAVPSMRNLNIICCSSLEFLMPFCCSAKTAV